MTVCGRPRREPLYDTVAMESPYVGPFGPDRAQFWIYRQPDGRRVLVDRLPVPMFSAFAAFGSGLKKQVFR